MIEASIRKTYRELDIEIIDMSVNPSHLHLFIKYPLKYPVNFISKRFKESGRYLDLCFPN